MKFQEVEEEVVISGIGCRLPEADSLEEFAEKLFSGQTMVTRDDRKLSQGLFENLPEYSGKIRDTRKFDYTFFGISNIVVQCMDPMTQQIMERTFEAVMDAGINPCELRGTDTAVYSGTSISDFDLEWATNYKGGYGIMGRNRCMNANRVSYWLDLKGTSVSLDNTWANGISNLMNAWDSVRKGRCDTALVSTANLQSNAEITIQLNDLGLLSPNGICRSFDDSANGYVRSDAIVVFVLQRASIAKRSYGTIAHIFSKCCGYRDNVIHKPLQKDWENIFQECYSQTEINPEDICYLEGNGSGIKAEDEVELNAVTNFFCRNRKSPLLIGSVKSNMGHAEAAAASCGLLKALICLQRDSIPQNINFTSPNSACHGFQSGKLKLVDSNMPLPEHGYVAVNAHGFGGVYAHLILKPNRKCKTVAPDAIPRLVLLAGRTDDLLDNVFNKVESMPFDPNYVSLLNEINSKKVDKYLGRGYTILPKREGATLHERQVYNEMKRPVWFIFSGMGSQWPTMGKSLMNLPLFRKSIEKCHKILEPKGLNLIKIITDDDPKIFDNILHSFVGIAAVQIALVDILRALEIEPDGMIGHSVGELGCAYADGCFTAEQMILSAYSRGRASIESNLIRGYMAAIGRGYAQIKNDLPEGIEVACHNASDSCTISGPAEMVQDYVKQLELRGIFAKTVNVSNIAYHSRYIKPAAPRLLKYLKEVIPNPKLRSSKWISTSNTEENWNSELAKYCSAEYHTNNLLSSVLFEEGSKHIPNNAICIEIAPHGLLQAILKRSLGENCTNIPLTRRTADVPLNFLLQAIGKLYMIGLEPQINNIFPKVEYPILKATPSIHQLIYWDHEIDLTTAQTRAEKKVIYSFKNHLLKFASEGTGYIINGENTYPIAIFLHLIWGIFSSSKKRKMEDCPIIFEKVRFESPLVIHPSKNDEGMIALQKGTGDFEINMNRLLVQGTISLLTDSDVKALESEQPLEIETSFAMSKEEIYNEFQRRGIDVGESFKPLSAVYMGNKGWKGELDISGNWVQILESLFQLQIMQLGEESEKPLFPKSFEKLSIVPQHYLKCKSLSESKGVTARYNIVQNIIQCGGLKMKGLKTQELPLPKSTLQFTNEQLTPLINPPLKDVWQYVDLCFGIVADNTELHTPDQEINILEVTMDKNSIPIGKHIENSFAHMKMKVLRVPKLKAVESKKMFDLIICSFSDLAECGEFISEHGAVLLKRGKNHTGKMPAGMSIISKFSISGLEEMILVKKRIQFKNEPKFITISKKEDQVISALYELSETNHPVYLISFEKPESGMDSYKKRLQSETSIPLRWLFYLNENSDSFDPTQDSIINHLQLGLSVNVLHNGVWGVFNKLNYIQEQMDLDYFNVTKLNKELSDICLGFDFSRNFVEIKEVDFCGELKDGGKIMGIGSVIKDTSIVRDKYLSWNLPSSWSFEDGATVPLSYVFSYYCIVMAGQLKTYESLLVTDGYTPIGMAAIHVGLSVVPRVYVTVNNEEEAKFIKNRYPSIPSENILCHKDKNFHILLGIQTKGEYPEMIINSLEGERLMSTVSCLPAYGRIFHFGADDYKKNTQLGTSVFLLSTSFYSMSQESLCSLKDDEKQWIHQLMTQGIRDGVVKPLPKKLFNLKEFHRVLSEEELIPRKEKIILGPEAFSRDISKLYTDSDSSYVIIGDETEVWVDVMRSLIRKGVRKIVISHSGHDRLAERHAKIMKKCNIVIHAGREIPDVQKLIDEARKMGTLSAVFLIALKRGDASKVMKDVDRIYKDNGGCLMVISKEGGVLSDVCIKRNCSGFPSTNFIWVAEESLIGFEMGMLNKLCGKEATFHVSHAAKGTLQSDSMGLMLKETLPVTVQDFCNIGASLSEEVNLVKLPSQKGLNREGEKEINSLIFIGGLQSDPAEVLQPMAKNLLYPVLCVRLPHMKLSVRQLVSFILPKIFETNDGDGVFNIIGMSWGCYVAIELAKQIEEIGASVGLILIDCPHQNLRQSLASGGIWESDLLHIIQNFSKAIQSDALALDKTWSIKINRILATLNLTEEEENCFRRAADFIHNSLEVFMEYNYAGTKLRGPLTIVKSGLQSFDDRSISKMCNSISVRHIPLPSGAMLNSKELREIIHGSAVTKSMSESTVNMCSWRTLQDFLIQQKINNFNSMNADFRVTATKLKFSFTH